jgi:Xaa-Pro dipeptidase
MMPSALYSDPNNAEIHSRLIRLQARMAEQALDYYICQCPDNILYLTNFANFVHERPFILVVPGIGQPLFVVPRLEREHVRIRSVGELELVEYSEFPAAPGYGWQDRLLEVLPAAARIGVEPTCPLFLFRALGADTVGCDLVDRLRQRKSAFEIGRIRYTCELLNQGHALLLENARPDKTFVESHGEINRVMMTRALTDNPRLNLLSTSLAALVQPPEMSHDPHNFTDSFSRMTRGGPHTTIVAGRVNGYGAELERNFFLGTVPKAARKPFDCMLEARALAFELLKPGANMGELDRRVNGLLRARGYSENLLHRTGHSFGVTGHEAPFLADGYDEIVEAGMVFSIEPGIYLPGVGGFRFSDTVLVTESGCLSLTKAPETLSELTLPLSEARSIIQGNFA